MAGNGPRDVIAVDVPMLLRLLEYAREDAKTDMDLHVLIENLLNAMDSKNTLTMADYDAVVPKAPPQTALARYFYQVEAGRGPVKNPDLMEYRKLAFLHRHLHPRDRKTVESRMHEVKKKLSTHELHELSKSVPHSLQHPELPGVIHHH